METLLPTQFKAGEPVKIVTAIVLKLKLKGTAGEEQV